MRARQAWAACPQLVHAERVFPNADDDSGAALPLDGIRVLELCGPAGSYGGRLLADAGADVVKVGAAASR